MVGRDKSPQVIELEQEPHTLPKKLRSYPFSRLELAEDGSEMHLFSKDGVEWEDKTAELEDIVEDYFGHSTETWLQATGGATEKRKRDSNVTKWLRSNQSKYLEAHGNTPAFVIRAMAQAIALQKADKRAERAEKRNKTLKDQLSELQERFSVIEARLDQPSITDQLQAQPGVSYAWENGRMLMIKNGEVIAKQERVLFDPLGRFVRRRQAQAEPEQSTQKKPRRRVSIASPIVTTGASERATPATTQRRRLRKVDDKTTTKPAPAERRSIWGPVAAVAAVGALALSAVNLDLAHGTKHEVEENEQSLDALANQLSGIKNAVRSEDGYVIIHGKRIKLERYIAQRLAFYERSDKKRQWRASRDIVNSVIARINRLDHRMTRQHIHDHGHEMLAIHGNNDPHASYFHPDGRK
jgi:hypothetical protein